MSTDWVSQMLSDSFDNKQQRKPWAGDCSSVYFMFFVSSNVATVFAWVKEKARTQSVLQTLG